MSDISLSSKNYNFAFDVVRCLAIIGIIAIHVLYPIYARTDFMGGISWWIATVINTFSRPSVPLFVILSGALLMSSPQVSSWRFIVSKTFFRVVVPLVVWSSIYLWWETSKGSKMDWGIFLDMLASGNLYHLYFLVILVPLYLHAPGLALVFQQKSKTLPLYFMSLGVVLGLCLGFVAYFIYKNSNVLNAFTLWLPYAGYFFFGKWAVDQNFTKRQLQLWLLTYVVSTLATLFLGINSLRQLSEGNLLFWKVGGLEYFTDYHSPTVTANALSLFVLLISYLKLQKKTSQLVMAIKLSAFHLARASFGMYLIHSIVINVYDQLGYFTYLPQYGPIWVSGLSKLMTVVVTSFVVVSIIKRVPFLKVVIGEKT